MGNQPSQPPGQIPQDRGLPGLPGFAPVPPGRANPDPEPPAPTSSGTPADSGDGGGSGSSAGIRDRIPIKELRSGPYEAIARGLLRAAGGLLNSRIQVDEEDKSFIPDDDDDKTIPPPLGRVAARHLPVSGKAELSELEDIGAAAVGLLAWAAKGLVSMWEARRDKRRVRKAAGQAGAAVYEGGTGDEAGQL